MKSVLKLKIFFNEYYFIQKHINKSFIGLKHSTIFYPKCYNYFGIQNLITNSRFISKSCVKFNQELEDDILKDSQFSEFTNRLYKHPGTGHNILMIQPRLKSGPKSETLNQSELKLSEAIALVNTLPNWKVVEKLIIPSHSLDSKLIFGKGTLEKLQMIIQKNLSITAIFIGIDILTALQNAKLENIFKMQVFDRYQIVLQIFHDHAHTKEAKLQVALAEIPYLRVKLCEYSYYKDSIFSEIHHVGGDGETYMETRRRLLNQREIKIKKALEKIKNQRQILRRSERRTSLPIIAVVGYTNCGKTSLIKAFTKDERLIPQDKLFATLDVTIHGGLLPSSQKVLYIDTVGFISDVPTTLIQSFKSTLEEIALADLVIHVRDITHPDSEMQKKVVLQTLRDLELPSKLLDTIIEVGNKIDLLERPIKNVDKNLHLISATEGIGLPNLLEIIENQIIQNAQQHIELFKIPNGGEEYSWLYKEACIRDAMVDKNDANYLIVEAIISSSNLAKFKHHFGDKTIKFESLSNNV